MNPQENQVSSRLAREKVNEKLKTGGGLRYISKELAQYLKLPNIRYFGTEKEEAVERREDWLEQEEFAKSRKDTKKKLVMLVEMLENSDDIVESAAVQKQKIEALKDKNLTQILKKSRKIEQSWRELDLFYTNIAQQEVRNLTIINTDPSKIDEAVLTDKIGEMLDKTNSKAIDQNKNYSFLVAPGFIGQSLIEKFADIAFRNKTLFLTDYKNENSVDRVVEVANEEGKAKLGGNDKSWSRTVVFTNYALLREQYTQERRKLFGSPTALVAGKLYAINNIAQPIAGAQFGPLKGLKGIRFPVNQEQANVLDRENFNPLVNAFGALMPFNCVTLFKGENIELRQYNVIRTLDYVDKVLKHFLNQYVFTSMEDSDIRHHVHRTIKGMLEYLVKEKILKSGRITHFDVNENRPDRFDIKLEVYPMFVTSAFEYTIGIDENGTVEGENDF